MYVPIIVRRILLITEQSRFKISEPVHAYLSLTLSPIFLFYINNFKHPIYGTPNSQK